jgi:hypothetical protein
VARGRVDHAIRVTVDRSQAAHLWPARHHAGQAGASLPPMGLRLRLRAGVDIAGFPSQARVILQAMRTYGLVVADNGSSGFIGGVPDERWDNDALHQLGRITLADFEAVDTTALRVSNASAAARGTAAAPGGRPDAGTARPARPGKAAAPANPAAAGRPARPEPRLPADLASLGDLAATTAPPAPAAARGPQGPAAPGLVPWFAAGLLGLVAAVLAVRMVVRARRPAPPGRHVRAGPDRPARDPGSSPPGRDPAGSRRR